VAYPLGFSIAELSRLSRQHETWRASTEQVWRAARFGSNQTIVDLGCGPGFTTCDLARLVGPGGTVIGVDASPDAIASAHDRAAREGLTNVRFRTTNAGAVDLAADEPDGIFARWLFCYVSDPAAVIARAASSLRRGGTFAIIDYWNYLAITTEPRAPIFDRVFRAVYQSFADAGGSLDVAGALPAHLRRAGLSVSYVEPVAGVGRPGSPVWNWIADFQTLYLPALVERGYLTSDVVAEYLAWWTSMEGSEAALVFAPPMLSVVAVKP
jgi:ubiquinone/menaquinone biosynthesis C-methylase UbiE